MFPDTAFLPPLLLFAYRGCSCSITVIRAVWVWGVPPSPAGTQQFRSMFLAEHWRSLKLNYFNLTVKRQYFLRKKKKKKKYVLVLLKWWQATVQIIRLKTITFLETFKWWNETSEFWRVFTRTFLRRCFIWVSSTGFSENLYIRFFQLFFFI